MSKSTRGLILAAAFMLFAVLLIWFNSMSTDNVPGRARIREDLAIFLQIEPRTSEAMKIEQLIALDGWSDGLELNVQFSLTPQKFFEPLLGPLAGSKFNEGSIYKNGEVDFSYSKDNEKEWKLLSAKLKKVPLSETK